MMYVFEAMRDVVRGVWFGMAGVTALGVAAAIAVSGWHRMRRRWWTRRGITEIEDFLAGPPPTRGYR